MASVRTTGLTITRRRRLRVRRFKEIPSKAPSAVRSSRTSFSFYDYAGRRDAESQSVSRTVPLANMGQGIMNYQYCTDATCSSTQNASLTTSQLQQVYSATGINPTAIATFAAVSAKYPANDVTSGDQVNTGGFRFNAPTPVHLNSHVAKFDFNPTSKQNAFVRLQVQDDHQTLPQWLPGSISPQVWEHSWGLAVGHTGRSQ